MADTFGDRVVDIRQRRGGGARSAVKQPEMADLLAELAGVPINGQRLSRIESGTELKFYEAVAILRALVALDPQGRSYEWLIGTEPLPLKKRPGRRKAKNPTKVPRRELELTKGKRGA